MHAAGDTTKPTLSITDNRTGKTYEVPIQTRHDSRDRSPADQGQRRRFRDDDVRSGVHEHRLVQEQDHVHRRRQGDPALPGIPHRAACREVLVSGSGLPA